MDSNINKNRNKVFVLLGVICLIMVIGVSFALWQLTFTQSGTNVITTGCLQLKFTEDTDAINLTDATPTSDEEGKGFTPFTFTIENVCTTETSYVVNLETVSSGDKILADNYVKVNLTDGTNEVFLDNLLDSHENLEKVISEASKAYKLYQGKLRNKEKVSFNLRLWMDEATPADDAVMEALWQGKITVTATYVPPVSMKNVMVAMEDILIYDRGYRDGLMGNNIYTQNGKYGNDKDMVEKVIYESKMKPYENAEEIVDFSMEQDRSVLGYYVKNENNKYTLYIQANGKIKVNPKASYYGYVYYGTSSDADSNVYGTENWDLSLVTDMSYMFYCITDTDADFTTWDTSKVTTMSNMFSQFDSDYSTSSRETLNLSNFDTSNVTDMSSMFYQYVNLTTTFTIRNKDVTYSNMFLDAATEEGSQITLNYTADTESVVDAMIASKPADSNVVKGVLVS